MEETERGFPFIDLLIDLFKDLLGGWKAAPIAGYGVLWYVNYLFMVCKLSVYGM